VLESKQAQRLEELGLPLTTLLGDRGALDRWLAESNGGDLVGPARQQVEEALAGLRGQAVAADPGLERPFEKTREQILHALDLFGEKAVAAAVRKNDVVGRRVQQIRDACVPMGKLQERIVATAHYPGKYGPDLLESYWRQMELDAVHLQVINPNPGDTLPGEKTPGEQP
jgi:uncharacterized protein YllA (UPF0747 family)